LLTLKNIIWEGFRFQSDRKWGLGSNIYKREMRNKKWEMWKNHWKIEEKKLKIILRVELLEKILTRSEFN